MNTKEDLTWDFILENEITTKEGIEMATYFGGYSIETLNRVIYSKTGMHDIEQLWNCCKDEFYFSDELIEEYELN